MKRVVMILCIALLPLAWPRTASADWFGVYVQGHAGYQKTNRTAHPVIGAAAGVTLLGIEAFADLRFLRDGLGGERGMWNQLGLRYGIGLPLPKIDLEVFAGLSYVYSVVADEDMATWDPDERAYYMGLNPHLGARLDIPLFGLVSLGVQVESGIHYLLPNDLEYSTGPNFDILANLKVSI